MGKATKKQSEYQPNNEKGALKRGKTKAGSQERRGYKEDIGGRPRAVTKEREEKCGGKGIHFYPCDVKGGGVGII